MEDESDQPPRPRAARRAALLLAAALVAALVALWAVRRPVATRFVDRALARAGVPARYTVADLGFGRQRLTDVVIGDPADPDLVADWIETRVGYGLAGPEVQGIAAGRVRLRGRVVDGRVSLGAIDRLLPAPSGRPFALPALSATLADVRVRLETPAGLVGIKLAGRGVLNDGFAGTVAAVAPALRTGGCTGEGVAAALRVRIADAAPTLAGPVRATRLRCGGVAVATARADLTLTLAAALDRWTGRARLATGGAGAGAGAVRIDGVAGILDFAGTARATAGRADLAATRLRAGPVSAERLAVAGRYRIGDRTGFAGRANWSGGRVDPAMMARATAWRDAAAGTPAGPLAVQLADAVRRAGARFAGDAALVASPTGVRVSRLALAATSGARIALADGAVEIGGGGVRIAGRLASAGGGLPVARVSLAQAATGAPVRGTATVAPYRAAGARLALAPLVFSATPGGATRVTTRATLSGPLADGRVEALALPVQLLWDGRERLVVNPGCAPLAWQAIVVGNLRLAPATLALCPADGALLRSEGGRLAGGARIAGLRLAGRIGGTPLLLEAGDASVGLADRRVEMTRVAAALGQPERPSRLALATLTADLADEPVGSFTGGGGRIGAVPLVLSDADGRWRFAGGVLTVEGAMTVADAAAAARFRPMAARGVTLRLADGQIAAAGTLAEPGTGERVAEVRIAHALASGTGTAELDVPGLAFREGFQPELLTPLTYGVVADVRGTVTGWGRIAWSADGVTSSGAFSTSALDLAAAFGPVAGIATTIRFTDLLGMRTAPGQVATVRSVNPGIPVEDGTVRYQLLSPSELRVEGARWPFAGGTLALEPTLLDFSQNRARRMTFRIDGAAADRFLQQFDFDNLDATGTFDGVLPMVFDQDGGRIVDGRLAVRAGGGTIAYVGTLTQEQLGFWGDLAFQALKSLRYRSLALTLNGPLTGEMVTDVRFAGVSQGEGAKGNILVRRLQRLPFVFNIRIKAPFRGLLDSARSFYDPSRLIQRNLPALIEAQRRAATPPVQPPASETVR